MIASFANTGLIDARMAATTVAFSLFFTKCGAEYWPLSMLSNTRSRVRTKARPCPSIARTIGYIRRSERCDDERCVRQSVVVLRLNINIKNKGRMPCRSNLSS